MFANSPLRTTEKNSLSFLNTCILVLLADNAAYEIVLIGLIERALLNKYGVFNKAPAAGLLDLHKCGVGVVGVESDLRVADSRAELAVSLKADLAVVELLPPHSEAIVVDILYSVLKIEAGSVLIAVAVIVPVGPSDIVECIAVLIITPAVSLTVERVDISQVVTALSDLNTYLNTGNSHICYRIVTALDEKTDGVESTASYYIYVEDILVG